MAVEIYKYIPEFAEGKLVLANDAYFNVSITAKSLGKAEKLVLKHIDSAEIIDGFTGAIKTPFGITSIKNISTGCKTVLNYNHTCKNNIDLYIDASECGANALEILFEFADKFERPVILRHDDNTWGCSSRQYIIHTKAGKTPKTIRTTDSFKLSC